MKRILWVVLVAMIVILGLFIAAMRFVVLINFRTFLGIAGTFLLLFFIAIVRASYVVFKSERRKPKGGDAL